MSKSLEQAKAELERARVELAHVVQRQAEHAAALARAKEQLTVQERQRAELALEAVLASGGEGGRLPESTEVQRTRALIETAEATLAPLQQRLDAAYRAVIEARAACLMLEADALERQAAERQVKTDELLSALKEWEGCTYAPEQPDDGDFVPAEGEVPGVALSKDLRSFVVRDSSQDRWATKTIAAAPKTEQMRQQATYWRETAEKWLDGKPAAKSIYFSGKPLWPLPDYLGHGYGPGDGQTKVGGDPWPHLSHQRP